MDTVQTKRGLRIVSTFEAAKGLLVLLTGFGLFAYVHNDAHLAAENLVRHFHLNPASHYPHVFLDLADHASDGQLWALALSAALYAAIRFIVALGLWRQKTWAKWFGVFAGGLYIPIEVYEIIRGMRWAMVALLLINAGVVVYLSSTLMKRGAA